MARSKSRRSSGAAPSPSPFEEARDELFQQMMTCGVIGADAAHQKEWFDDTLRYFGERYPELTERQHQELRQLGERFALPPKARASA